MRPARWLIGIVVVVVVAALLMYSRLPAPMPDNSVSERLLDGGIYRAGSLDVQMIDTERPTTGHGKYPGASSRRLVTTIWYPAVEQDDVAPGAHPLIIFCHGFLSSRAGGTYLGRMLARQGYIVVAADFPLTRFGAPGGAVIGDVVNQPGDVSFLIGRMLAANEDTDSPFFKRIDRHRIGVMGVSLGGLTAMLVGYHRHWRDPRVAVVVSIAGPTAMLGPRFFATNGKHKAPPLLMIASKRDVIVPYAANAAPLPGEVGDGWLVSLAAGSHAGFTWYSRYLRWLGNPDRVACELLEHTLDGDLDGKGWIGKLGDAGDGIVAERVQPACTEPAGAVMNPIRQQWETTLAVYNFLQIHFADTERESNMAKEYLSRTMSEEFKDVSVVRMISK